MLEKFRPNETAESLSQIDLESLRQKGIKGIICDIDNTLLLYKEAEPKSKEKEWIDRAKEEGFSVILLSNALPRRAASLSQILDIPAKAQAIKPSRKGFRKALKILDLSAKEVAVIGDQLCTDILGGNRMGMYTILVAPLGTKEFISTKFMRILERWIKKHLQMQKADVKTADVK